MVQTETSLAPHSGLSAQRRAIEHHTTRRAAAPDCNEARRLALPSLCEAREVTGQGTLSCGSDLRQCLLARAMQ